jgi:hypothetical protein
LRFCASRASVGVSPAEARSRVPSSRHSMRKRPPDGHWTRPFVFRLRATLPQPLVVLIRRRMLTVPQRHSLGKWTLLWIPKAGISQ